MATVIFDLDGTLADTSADLIGAANSCFEVLGLGHLLDPKQDATTAFRGGRAMLRLGLSRAGREGDEAEVERQFPVFLEYYADRIDRETVIYPGVEQAVRGLRSIGYRTGICTNKPEVLAVDLVQRLGLSDLFDSLIGADTLPTRKPDPAPYVQAVKAAGGIVERSLIVGDTETDRKTAIAVGVPCVLVAFGPEGPGISRLRPDAMLEDYGALPDVVARLIGRP